MSRRERREAAGDIPSKRLTPLPFLIAGIVVVIVTALTLWWFVWRESPSEEASWEWNDEPGLDGIHAHDVPPEDWEAGYCLTGFENEHSPADVIDCDEDYDTQLLLRTQLEGEEFPGDEAVTEQAQKLCDEGVELNQAAVDDAGYELALHLWRPTEQTWDDQGDRRVDCMLAREDEQQLSGSFLAEEPEGADEPEDEATEEPAEESPEPSPEDSGEGAGDDEQ